MRLGILIAALALQTGASFATTGKTPPPVAFRIVKAEFGVLAPGGFQPSTRVPLREGQGFGWVIELTAAKDRLRWREEIRLPAAPEEWRFEDKDKDSRHSLSADRRTSILERESRIVDGVIYNFWQISRGDPKGRYSMRIMIEGLLVSTFEFDVE
jgi:hypothetical protein